jgi:putative heme-binding domain-containing protein
LKFQISDLKLFSVPLCLCGFLLSPAQADEARDALIVETLLKLERYDLSTVKPETRQAALRHIDTRGGTQRYVELVELFNLRDRADSLRAMVIEKPDDPVGIAAARTLLRWGRRSDLQGLIEGADSRAASAAVRVLGATQNKQALELLGRLACDEQFSMPLRGDAVRALGRAPAGERLLLELLGDGKLPASLVPLAGSVLLVSRDAQVREQAARYAPPASTARPPIRDLITRRGDPAKGVEIYVKATCIACHRVADQGIDFGPALSEIGSKLSREALYESIISPDAGISFGYEGVLITLASGQQLLGYIASETDGEIVLRQMGGVSTSISKPDIRARQPQTQSLMPPNLHLIITEQELVDLVEYLVSLRHDS